MAFLDSVFFGGRKKCPVCGMDVTEQAGIKKHQGRIFCSQGCVDEYERGKPETGRKRGTCPSGCSQTCRAGEQRRDSRRGSL